jgi:hypothetical protein
MSWTACSNASDSHVHAVAVHNELARARAWCNLQALARRSPQAHVGNCTCAKSRAINELSSLPEEVAVNRVGLGGSSTPGLGCRSSSDESPDRSLRSALLRVPSESRPRGPEMDRPRLHNPHSAYHEAGHAVAFWHFGIRFRYATLKPRDPEHFGHVYGVRLRETEDPGQLAIQMQVAAAGDIAYGRIMRLTPVPTNEHLLRKFSWAAANLHDSRLGVDEHRFISTALRRDSKITTDDTRSTGPASWLNVWRDTEQLIRLTLWSAVYAVAWEMVFSSRALTHAEIAAIARAGMAQDNPEMTDA